MAGLEQDEDELDDYEGEDDDIEHEHNHSAEVGEEDEDEDDEDDDDDDDDDDDEDSERSSLHSSAFGGGAPLSSMFSHGLQGSLFSLSGMMSAGMMSEFAMRFSDIRSNLKQREDPGSRMVALQELSNLLLVSTEEMFTSSFSAEQIVHELVDIMANPIFGEDDPESMLVACRCLASLMDALPQSTRAVVYGGAVPVLCQKLLEIEYIDLAEQALSTLKRVSADHPTVVVREGGLTACLTYLDFFATNVQRTAVIVAANCSRNIPSDCFPTVRDVMPILLNVLMGTDQKVVEQGCLSVARIIESFRHHPEKLEQLVSEELLQKMLDLLIPGPTNVVGHHIHAHFLKALSYAAKASPKLAATMFKMHIVDTLYQILTSISPPTDSEIEEQVNNSVMVMQTVIHSPKDQVLATLNVVCELLPGIQKDDLSQNPSFFETMDNLNYNNPDINEKKLSILVTCQPEVRRFVMVLLPVLLDVYSCTVDLGIRQKVVTAFLKIFLNIDVNILHDALKNVQFSSLLASILAQKDHLSIVVCGLQIADVLRRRLPDIYEYHFEREGVIAEISKLAADKPREVKKSEEKAHETQDVVADDQDGDEHMHDDEADEEEKSEVSSPISDNRSQVSSPDSSRANMSSLSHILASYQTGLDQWVANSAQEFLDKYVVPSECNSKAASGLNELKRLADSLVVGPELEQHLLDLVQHFSSEALTSISSFELLNSGIMEALLKLLTSGSDEEKLCARKTFLRTFMDIRGMSNASSAFSILIVKLQESLVRSEHFDVLMSPHSGVLEHENPTEVLSQQIRLKLVADDDADILKSYRVFAVSIPAVASFKSLEDYLRMRIGDKATGMPSGSRRSATSGVLNNTFTSFASFAASAASSSSPQSASSSSAALRSFESAVETGEGTSASAPADIPEASKPKAKSTNDDQTECDDERQAKDSDAASAMSSVNDDLLDRVDDYMSSSQETEGRRVNVQVDGDHVTAQTPGGTGISTPVPSPAIKKDSGFVDSMSRSAVSTPRQSYSSALQSSPQDWHIEFRVNDKLIPNDMTVFGAIHKYGSDKSVAQSRHHWDVMNSVRFRKVPGPAPVPVNETLKYGEKFKEVPESLKDDNTSFMILQLLRILYALNANLGEIFSDEDISITPLPVNQFISSKLTSKLNRQLEEPLIVASACLPDWSSDLTRHYPFLFPFETRRLFLQSTSFGHFRSVNRWKTRGSDTNRRDSNSNRAFIFKTMRQKVRIARSQILQSAIKVMELYGSSPSILEVEYFDEVGTGLGPTLEFYATVSREFAKKKLRLWRENESDPESEYAFGTYGLYPMPMSESRAKSESGKKVLHLFKILGQFVARAHLDSRLLDITFNPMFFRAQQDSVAPSLGSVKTVDAHLARSLKLLQKFSAEKHKILADTTLSDDEKNARLEDVEIDSVKVDDLTLDFTLPGQPEFELSEGSANVPVTIHNVDQYVKKVIDATLGSGVEKQLNAFREGFSSVFSFAAMSAFTPEELVMLCGQIDEDWSLETLFDSVKADHGYTMSSKTVQNLLEVMTQYDVNKRRAFLQFITGSPNLPIGGFKSLTPTFTIVCKSSEPPYSPDDYLPSVMTCVNYLKIPDYSTKEVLRARVTKAIEEGSGAFLLS
ncbi:hypothetical protein V1517DRAFT_256294 [Lipomyces orientalis]|uniref:Uncharacterized protein n=1 Tax=Lipomyces orientalis TaxID=1233043 RepID=A0ACC3TVX1_9ASCO